MLVLANLYCLCSMTITGLRHLLRSAIGDGHRLLLRGGKCLGLQQMSSLGGKDIITTSSNLQLHPTCQTGGRGDPILFIQSEEKNTKKEHRKSGSYMDQWIFCHSWGS